MVAGTAVAIVFAALQSSCDNASGRAGTVLVPHAAKCSGYGTGAGIGVGVLALGALLVVLAGLSTTALFRGRQSDPSPDDDTDPPPDDPPEGQSVA
jgi:hypothetical protein